MRTIIIAEAGSAHDGSLPLASEMIVKARTAGADYVKFQYWSSAKRLAERRQSGEKYEAIYERYRIRPSWLSALAGVARDNGIGFMCTAYLPEDIETVALFVDHFKVASFEAGDMEFITAHYPFCQNSSRQLIVSTGLQGDDTLRGLMAERDRALARGERAVTIKLLHCVSAYPASAESLAMRQIRTMNFDGFSDHAAVLWPSSGAVAVALGAKILEVHFRLTHTDDANPDAPHALLPGQLKRYIKDVRTAEAAIGEEPWRQHNPAEDAMRPYKVKP